MDKSPVVESFRLTGRGDVEVVFTGRTGITFESANNGSPGLESVIVSCCGVEVAYCNVRRWSPGRVVVFNKLAAPATAVLVGMHCLAAYDKIHEDIEDVTNSSASSLDDHLRILDIVSPGEECYLAMKNDSYSN